MKNNESKESKGLVPALRFPEFVNDGEWEVLLLEDGFDFISTNTLTRNQLNNKGGEFQNVHYGDVLIKYGSIIEAQEDLIPYVNEDVNCQKYSTLNDGDIIIADTAEDETVGKACEIRGIGQRKVLSGLHTFCLRPADTFASKYLGYWFNTNQYHNQLLRLIQGAKVCSISKKALSCTKILCPTSTEEQQKIADCLSSLDKCVQATKDKVESLKEYKRGLMQKLFPARGKSTPEFRFLEFANDHAWEEKTVGEFYHIQGGNAFKSSEFRKKGIPIIRISNIPLEGLYIDLKDCVYYNQIPNESTFVVKRGDLLIAMSGATTGKTAVYNDSEKAYLNQRVGIFKQTKDGCFYKYMTQWVSSELFAKQLQPLLAAGAQPNISSNNIESMLLPVPPTVEEQRKVAETLCFIDELIELYSKKTKELEKQKKGLMRRLFPE